MKRILGTALAGLALAAAPFPGAVAGPNDPGWSAGIGGLFSQYELDNEAIDDSAVGLKFAGQYRINRWLGIEGAWQTTGQLEEDTTPNVPGGTAELKVKGFTANVIGYVPLSDDFNVFGKAGFYRFDQYLDLDGFGTSRQADGLTLGAGVRVAVADQASLRLEGEWFDLEDADFWTVNLGVDFYFGAP